MKNSVSPKVELQPNTYIDVISLCNNLLNLRTNRGGAKPFYKTFRYFGEKQRVLYSDLVDIMDNHPTFVENGAFYIMNEDVIREHGKDDAYAKILTKDKIEKIVSGEFKSEDALALYKIANDSQKKVIMDIIIERIRDEKEVDKNFVYQLEKVSGKKIFDRVEDAVEFAKIQTMVPPIKVSN